MNNLHCQLNDHPLHRSIYDLCVEIEKLPPSEHATKLVTMAGALQQPVASLRADLAAAQGEVERLKQESKDSTLVTGIAMSAEIRLGKELAQMTENAKGWQKKWYEERASFDTLWKNTCIWKEDSCELSAIRKELAALREDRARLIDALEACAVFTTPLERLKNWNEYKEHATRLRNAALAACAKEGVAV